MREPAGHQTKPSQLRRSSRVTIEAIGTVEARIQGTYDVAIAGAHWRERPEFGETLEREIEDAIRSVLEKYAAR